MSEATMQSREPVNGVVWLGAQLLGVALAVFSAPAIVAPRFFGRLAGLPMANAPAASVAIQSVAVRDVAMGIGLVSAARHHGRLAPWLLIRALCDGGDAVAIAAAFARGGGNARLGGLGVLALGAMLYDLTLYVVARRDQDSSPSAASGARRPQSSGREGGNRNALGNEPG